MRMIASRLWHSPTFTTWGSIAVRMAGVVVVLPIVLRHFGAPEVAVWQMFVSIFTVMILLDFGVAPTLSRMLSFACGGARLSDMANMRSSVTLVAKRPTDPTVAASVFQVMSWLYPRLGLAVLLIVSSFGTWSLVLPISQCADPGRAWAAWGVVLVGCYAGLLSNSYAAALQGMNSIAVLRRWEVATGLAQITTTVAALSLGADILWLTVVYQVWVVFNGFRNRKLLQSLHPSLFHTGTAPRAEVLRMMWPAAWRSGVGVLLSQGIIQASGLLYAQVATAKDLAAYLLALRLITVISQFSQAPFYSKLPQLGAMQAQGQREPQLALAQRGMRLAQGMLVAGTLITAVAVPWLLQRVGSHTPFVAPGVWALMSLAFFVERFGAMHLQLYSLTNHILWHVANGVTGVLMLASAYILFPHLGLAALPTAMLLAYTVFYAAYSVRQSSHAFGFSVWRFEGRASLPAGLCLLAGLGMLGIWQHLALPGH